MKHSVGLFSVIVLMALGSLVGSSRFTTLASQTVRPSVFSVAWSPDGSKLAVGRGSPSCSGMDNDVHILNTSTGKIISTLTGHSCEVLSVSWRPDGNQLVTTSTDGYIRIWDTNTWQLVFKSTELVGRKISVWSPDGRHFAALTSGYTGVAVLDAVTGEHQSGWCCDPSAPISVAWSPDASKLALASSDKNVYVSNASTGKNLLILSGHVDYATAVDWSPDGSKIASGGGRTDHTVRIWNAITGDALLTLQGHTDFVTSVVWSPDGRQVASSSNDGTLYVWDTTTGQQVNFIQSDTSVYSVDWSPDGSQLAYGGLGDTVQIIPAPQLQIPTPSATMQSEAQNPDITILSIEWSPTGNKIAAGYSDGHIDIIDGSTGQTSITLQGHSSAVVSIAWSPDESRIISGSLTPDNTTRIWNVLDGEEIYQFGNFGPDILAVGWSPDGNNVIAVPAEGEPQVWNPATGQLLSSFQVGTSTYIAWSPDSTKIAFGLSMGAVDIRSSSTLEELVLADITNRPPGGGHQILKAAWNQSGNRIAAGTLNGRVYIWDAVTGETSLELKASDYSGDEIILKRVANLSFNPVGNTIRSISGDGTVRTWNTDTGEILQTIQVGETISAAAWSPDGSHLAYALGDTMQIIPAPQLQTPTPSATMQSEAQVLRELLSYSTCQRTCFMGIEPGMTTQEQVRSYLATKNASYEVFPSSVDEANAIYFWDIDPDLPFPRGDYYESWISFENGIVSSVQLIRAVPISTVIEAYGNPERVVGTTISQDYYLIYREIGLAFYLNDYSSDQTTRIYILTDAFYQGALEYKNTIQDCTDVPATICAIATVTLAP